MAQIVESSTPPIVSATVPDWSREQLSGWWQPSHQLIKCLRNYQKWRQRKGILGYLFCRLNAGYHRFWSIVTGAELPLNCENIEGGLMLPHPNGVILHPDVHIGPNCMIFQQVTIVSGVKIGGHVDIGAGAKIIRSVTIGDHAAIGANAVVICDVPPGATAVGIPARIIEKNRGHQNSLDNKSQNNLEIGQNVTHN
ncbi:MAG: serine acetyltransferase [Oscillatoriaceae cyanobacterium Prado104]|jgi:serine O-acetyltransferase|nr:serine acetyltransferase [Oscillatoriaceae cyanobacterium Prado104]